MTWLTKPLALDLLAITIHGLQKAFDRINKADDQPAQVEQAPAATGKDARHPADDPQPAEPAPEPAPEPQQEQPAPDAAQLHTQAQNTLRKISITEGNDWITQTLFPHFKVTKLTDAQPGSMPELVEMAEAHLKDIKGGQ